MKTRSLFLFLSLIITSAFAEKLNTNNRPHIHASASYIESFTFNNNTQHTDNSIDQNNFIGREDKIEVKTNASGQEKTIDSNHTTGFKSRYNGILEAGFYLRTQIHSIGMLDTYFISGRQWTQPFYCGLGTGLHYIYDPGKAIIPLFLDMRYYFSDKKITPILITDFGINFDTQNSLETGIMAKLALGLRFMVSPKSALNLSLGYEIQQTSQRGYVQKNNGAVGLALGFSF